MDGDVRIDALVAVELIKSVVVLSQSCRTGFPPPSHRLRFQHNLLFLAIWSQLSCQSPFSGMSALLGLVKCHRLASHLQQLT